MNCKHNLTEQEAFNRGWCKCCKSFDCVPFKDERKTCPKCRNTGITDCDGDTVVICTNCVWGRRYAVEEAEYAKLAGEFDEMFLTG